MKRPAFVALTISAAISLVSCATLGTSGRIKVNAPDSQIIDWSDRNLGADPSPEWLSKLVRGNSEMCRKELGIDKSYIIKYSTASATTLDAAVTESRLNYYEEMAEELRTTLATTSVRTVKNTFESSEKETTMSTVKNSEVTLSEHELVFQFWQEIRSGGSSEGRKFVCYSVFKVPSKSYKNSLKNYSEKNKPACAREILKKSSYNIER